MGAGVAACYRGTRVYDQPQTRDVVKKWVNFYKVSIFSIKLLRKVCSDSELSSKLLQDLKL